MRGDSVPPAEASHEAGRVALRHALERLGALPGPIPRNARGAPVLPEGFCGSVSHSDALAAGLAARDEGWTLGLDVESPRSLPPGLADVLLSARERPAHAALGEDAARDALLVRLALKEALYKALDPWLCRFVAPSEATLELGPPGTARVALELVRGEGPFETELDWRWQSGHVLATARTRPSPGR